MMRRVMSLVMVTLVVGFGAAMLSPVGVAAESACDKSFLGFRPWYYNLTEDDCKIRAEFSGEDDFVGFVWTIVLNILSDLFVAVGYVALGFVIYGGYLYVLARGDAGRIAKGKRTVIAAVIGLVICILASLIANTIVNIMTGATGA